MTVELFDGSGAGLAARTHTLLQDKGFTVAADQKLSTRATTVIRYNPADDTAPAQVTQVLGDVQAAPDRDVAAGHVRVLLGKDFRSSAAGPGGAPSSTTATPSGTPAPPTSTAPPITAGDIPCVN